MDLSQKNFIMSSSVLGKTVVNRQQNYGEVLLCGAVFCDVVVYVAVYYSYVAGL